MEQWHVAALLATLTAFGGGLRWFFGWLDRRAKDRREHDEAQAMRYQAMQAAFLDALRKIQEASDEKLERHRAEHLADTKLFAQTLASMQRATRDSTRPSSQ